MKVSILGCGPAGLLAAYACEQYGHQVEIFSKKVKSTIPGAVFLHEALPDITALNSEGVVNFVKRGNKQGYAHKVYGNPYAECSWDLFPEGERPAWSMFKLYNALWRIYEDRIIDVEITSVSMSYFAKAELAISTIPATNICHNKDHIFTMQAIHVIDRTIEPLPPNTIIYNGDINYSWYRSSNIFGHEATESVSPFSEDVILQLDANTKMGYKPIMTDCTCFPQVVRVGRFGRWQKGILVHHAYKQTIKVLEAVNKVS
jgi:hypothetical protein